MFEYYYFFLSFAIVTNQNYKGFCHRIYSDRPSRMRKKCKQILRQSRFRFKQEVSGFAAGFRYSSCVAASRGN